MSEQQQRIKDVGEVFTPQNIVNDMVDLLPDLRVETTVLEPSVGEGVFLCEILKRKLYGTQDFETVLEALQTLYGVDIMLDNVQKTRENLLSVITCHCGLDPQSLVNTDAIAEWHQILQNNIRWGDSLACFEAKTENYNDIIYMKDLTEKDLKEMQFFDYQKRKWVKYIDSFRHDRAMLEEIRQQRNEYRKTINSQLLIFD